MSTGTKIEWVQNPDGTQGETWNPVRGCTKVSAGCKNCFAERIAERFRGVPGHPYEQGFDLRLVPEKLDEPLHWKKPRMVFVNSMSDLFHPGVPFEFIDQVFAVMALCPQHTFQVLTKRPERGAEYLNHSSDRPFAIDAAKCSIMGKMSSTGPSVDAYVGEEGFGYFEHGYLENVWQGVSIEDQETADERIPHLLRCPAAVRFLSCEPLLGGIDLRLNHWVCSVCGEWTNDVYLTDENHCSCDHYVEERWKNEIDWVIVGGESGSGARPMDLDWARSIRDQCKAAGTAFYMKQICDKRGRKIPFKDIPGDLQIWEYPKARAV